MTILILLLRHQKIFKSQNNKKIYFTDNNPKSIQNHKKNIIKK